MSKTPLLPQTEQKQAQEASPQRPSNVMPPKLPSISMDYNGLIQNIAPETKKHGHSVTQSLKSSLKSQLNQESNPVQQLNQPSMAFNSSNPTLNTDLPPIVPQYTPPTLSHSLSKQLSTSGTNDEFRQDELLGERYQITKKIGQGGMGQVFAALDQRLNREVVVKVSYAGGEGPSREDRARFEREALKMARLNHPNIVTIYDCGDHQGDQFLVMELIKGETLKSFVNRPDSLTPNLFKDIVTQLLRGVQEAHDHDVIHRDLKPSNLMWDGTRKLLKILDFGLARGVEGDTVTGTGHVHGSIQYMAPEQIRGESQGPATDIYAIGILCFQLISKTLPFRGENTVELMFQKLQKDPFDLLEQEKTPNWVTPALAGVIRSCLHLKPSDRPSTASDCLEQLLNSLPKLPEVPDLTNPTGFDLFSANTLSEAQQSDSKPLKSVLLENHKPLLVSAFFGGLLIQLATMLFSSEDPINTQIDLDIRKTASVYFTSVDNLSNSESQVSLRIDGKEQGLTPLQLEVKPGRRQVELVQGEWRFSKSYELKAGETYWYALPAPPELKFKLPTPSLSGDAANLKKQPAQTSTPAKLVSESKKKSKRKYRRTKRNGKRSSNKKRDLRRKNKSRKKTRLSGSVKKRQNKKAKTKKTTSIDVPLLELE